MGITSLLKGLVAAAMITGGVGFAGKVVADGAEPVPMHLICTGSSSRDETVRSGLFGTGRGERINHANSLSFQLAGEDGTARLPDNMLSGYRERNKDGSFNLVRVQVSANEITGQIRIHGMNKPRFRLDRLTGVVTIDGTLGDFSGRCEAFDPATVERKF